MYPTNTLGDARPRTEAFAFGGGSADAALTATAAQVSRATRTGGPVGMEAGAETGPYATLTSGTGTGTGARRALAEQLFTANYPKLAGWVRRLVDDDETAHEIASEAFVRLLSKWTSPDKLDNPQSYLYMIATNLVRDHWRKTERERRAMRTVTAGAGHEPYSDPVQDVDVRELLQQLPARLRDPFLLHYYAGFGVREIAVLLKRPDGTIKADLYHARTKLKEALAANATGGGGRRGGRRGGAAEGRGTEGRAEGRGTGGAAEGRGAEGKGAGDAR